MTLPPASGDAAGLAGHSSEAPAVMSLRQDSLDLRRAPGVSNRSTTPAASPRKQTATPRKVCGCVRAHEDVCASARNTAADSQLLPPA